MSNVNFAIPDFCSLISAQEQEPAVSKRWHQVPGGKRIGSGTCSGCIIGLAVNRARARSRETNWTQRRLHASALHSMLDERIGDNARNEVVGKYLRGVRRRPVPSPRRLSI